MFFGLRSPYISIYRQWMIRFPLPCVPIQASEFCFETKSVNSNDDALVKEVLWC